MPPDLRAGLLLASSLLGLGCPGGFETEPPDEATRWLLGYLRIDTVNPPGNEAAAARYLAAILEGEGISVRRLPTAPRREAVWAAVGPESAPALLLLHHLDVVPPGPGWSKPPFGGVLEEGVLWGRGAIDAKGLGITHLAALVNLRRSTVPLARRVVFLATPDEERGGLEGCAALLKSHPELFEGVEAVLNEGGFNRAFRGRVRWWGIEVAQKRPLWMEVAAPSPGRLVELLVPLVDRPIRWRVTPPVRDQFRALARLAGPHWRPIFAELDRYVETDGPTVDLRPGMQNYFLDSVQVNTLRSDESGRSVAGVDARLLPDVDEEKLVRRIRERLGDEDHLEVVLSSPRSPPSPTDHPLFALLEAALSPKAPLIPYFAAGVTDSRFFRENGIPAYGLSPFTLEGPALLGVHGPDERLTVDELRRGVARMERIVTAWAAGPGVESVDESGHGPR